MKRTLRHPNSALLIALLPALLFPAVQVVRAQTPIEPRPVTDIRVDKSLVLVPVSVLDSENRPVTTLARNNFRVFDEKTERPVENFSSEDEPIAVGIVFDSSGSMGWKLRYARAVKAFLNSANCGDQFLLIEFSGGPRLTVPLTTDTREIESRLFSTGSKGKTALLDAVSLGIKEIKKSKLRRKALLVISDGGDNHSRYNETEIRELIRESDVLIYAIGICEPLDLRDRTPGELAGPGLLKEIAQQTGGREFSVGYTSELSEIARAIGRALRNRYVLAFSPGAEPGDPRYHSVKVKIVRTHGLPLNAAWRPGYYAAAQ